ncbi:MAG: AsmA-like C-terminal domain-containing protein [Mariprofundaceae bacterium]
MAGFATINWRHVGLLLSLVLLALVAALQWLDPALKKYQPELQESLRQRLNLRELHFENLSWSWSGNTWLTADKLSLVSADGALSMADASLAVRISTWNLLLGEVKVAALSIRHPTLDLRIPEENGGTQADIPDLNLSIENARLSWHYGDQRGLIEELNVRMDGAHRKLLLDTPGVSFSLGWGAAGQPEGFDLRWQDTQMLPAAMRPRMRGDIGGQLQAEFVETGVWRMRADINGRGGSMLLDRGDEPLLPLGSLGIEALLGWSGEEGLQWADLSRLHWRDDEHGNIQATAKYRDGELALYVQKGRLAMPVLWSWLKGLGREGWRAWLKDMHHGFATELRGDLILPWPDLGQAPSREQWKKARYQVHTQVVGADLTLKTGKTRLTKVEAEVDLDQHGLTARLQHAELPASIGVARGQLNIRPWRGLVLDIKGAGDVDVARLTDWLGVEALAGLNWTEAQASGEFSFQWLPGKSRPREGNVRLTPAPAWHMRLGKQPLVLEGGELLWSADQNLYIHGMQARFAGLTGELDLAAGSQDGISWDLNTFDAEGSGGAEDFARSFRMPVSEPMGNLDVQLRFDGSWKLHADLADTGWGHLLGSHKLPGAPFKVDASGGYDNDMLRLSSLLGVGQALNFSGFGSRKDSAWHIEMGLLQTPSFDGSLVLVLPDSSGDPVEINVKGLYLDNNFLPENMPLNQAMPSRDWVLRFDLDRIIWNNAELTQAKGQFVSGGQGIGSLQARALNVANLQVKDVDALLSLPGSSVIDIHRLLGKSWGQDFRASVIVRPDTEDGLLWGGFVNMTGDNFGQLPKSLGWSERFTGGELRLMLTGSGRFSQDEPWWKGFDGRLRLRVDDGRLAEGGILTRLLSAANLAELPKLLIANRKDLIGKGMHFKRMQVEADVLGSQAGIHQLAMRASALDMAGNGTLDVEKGEIDLVMVMRPLQNLDKILGMIPLLRDVFGGAARSLFRKIYHLHGPLADARVEEISPEEVGLARAGLVESLIKLPGKWFGKKPTAEAQGQ